MKKKHILILSLFALASNLNAQNLWGVDASIDLTNAEFQNGFIETGTASNYSTSNWTALSINSNNGAVTPGTAYWKRSTLGYSQGAYWSGFTPVNSSSQANGVAIFDSDFMDNNGVIGGTGSSPSTHKGALISPRIDLTGNTDIPLAVKFYSLYRNHQITELSVSFSSDDGVTWGSSVDYRTLQSPESQGFVTLTLPISSTQGISNLSQCRIKYTFDGEYYFAIIDDITILNATSLSTSNSILTNKISLHPNPSNHYINISGLTKKEKYTIYDILGTEISKGSIFDNEKINIENYSNGFYLLKFENGSTLKFIKE